MNSSYTAIEPDEPLDSPPSYSANDHNTTTNTTTSNPSTQPYVNQPQADQPQQPGTSSSFEPRTLLQRLKESSHPIALLFYIFFRVSPIVTYIFGTIVIHQFTSKNTFILHFIVLILLVAGDFWNLKNISGRLLVGLRWWNETTLIESENGNGNGNASGQVGESAKDFENVWVFETADPNRYINPIDSKVFWLLLYGQPVAWVVLGVLAVLKLQFLYLLFIIVATSLSMTNAMAFTKCDKFGKANNFANDVFTRAAGSMFNNFNPFGR
ncbi:hypothetical protein FOB64_002970 [Candida albicans]|uniref:Golgi apparatus membrane protein TVP23 n=2 Tax=Candida albicans TaxID=5476 RepID=TVP23_CANAL|nr:RecName: Full=Golgi apparatus membrane protein TVP23 [Candida albicans SC5314]KAF6062702.1 hypothetical protein FOB64_005760 [Candida albicans]KAF6069674.1 hypothetical protein FOB64_002970 [Candida albicans]KHC89175.1 golgi apparatus membrane protein TVP23 [Candida albicans SC5314]